MPTKLRLDRRLLGNNGELFAFPSSAPTRAAKDDSKHKTWDMMTGDKKLS
jgi:hypothetical protein